MSMTNLNIVQIFSGDALRAARKALKMSQEEFAKPLGLTGGYVSKLEKNERLPKETVVMSMVTHYGLRRNWLESGEGEMFVTQDQSAEQKHSPEDEKLLEILKDMPRARVMMEAFLALPERKQQTHLRKVLESLEELEGEEKNK